VAGFLNGEIGFLDIVAVVAAGLEAAPSGPVATVDDVFAVDREARVLARERMAQIALRR
jgi:1-deoxy-D-xylulose-5-phosphate reductoisomerase